ncbi:hypothetical protein SARC_02874 [Sphaeroforma arctica JP610]|uniref:Tyr recombinase domain-containing protein n=1 Tax=Sphaeroforma arctica JP610 TaxID=667725 RepID=A0A0L0G7D6_9EUKA|nr:hypothetical protein SARC_02874 [Sphaeroforma arctica JP610]KNC84920.1 hypothetical protein SARC_02874 [Sphaeroforma arctica JP610]|eukprot:XP_014158822.1 hypothetical protein SARC_02874 [Sphaeroforma arctica JP610]
MGRHRMTVHTDLESYSDNLHIHRGKRVRVYDEFAEILLPISKTSLDRFITNIIPKLPANMAHSHRFRKPLTARGLGNRNYSGHSLRIGGLTALREVGVNESETMITGRWTSAVNMR